MSTHPTTMPPVHWAVASPSLVDLLQQLPLAPLGPGKPNVEYRSRLTGFTPESLLGSGTPTNREAAQACLAGLWLAFDFMEESHTISQDLDTREGSFWHAILHRREPDAWNSKYWWRRVGKHLVLDQLRERATEELRYPYSTPEAFVDFCEQTRDVGSADEMLARQVQRLEWELLFAWCLHRSARADG